MFARIPTVKEAVAVAMAVAADHGVRCARPELLHAAGNVWVHLAPAPVVAQVPKDVVGVRGASAVAHLRRDVDVSAWLAARGRAVGAPSDLLPAGPHERDGVAVAFYEHYQRGDERDDRAAGAALRELHETLAGYDGDLGVETPSSEARRLLGMLQAGRVLPVDVIRMLRLRLGSAEQRMAGWPTQPIHGDVHLQNVLWTLRGPLWTDWEDTCRAPVAWDLACLLASTEVFGIPADRLSRALDGYGPVPSGRELRPFVHARVVGVCAWAATRPHDPRAAKRLRDGLAWLRHRQL